MKLSVSKGGLSLRWHIRWLHSILFLLCVAFYLCPISARAAPTHSLTVTCWIEKFPQADRQFDLYRVGSFNEDGRVIYETDFSPGSFPTDLNENQDYVKLARNLSVFVSHSNIEPLSVGMTDLTGNVIFSSLDRGLYLVLGQSFTEELENISRSVAFEPILVFLDEDLLVETKHLVETHPIPNEPTPTPDNPDKPTPSVTPDDPEKPTPSVTPNDPKTPDSPTVPSYPQRPGRPSDPTLPQTGVLRWPIWVFGIGSVLCIGIYLFCWIRYRKKYLFWFVFGCFLFGVSVGLGAFTVQRDVQTGKGMVEILDHLDEMPLDMVNMDETSEDDSELEPVRFYNGQAYIGTLQIPALGLELPVNQTWNYDSLEISPCKYAGSYRKPGFVICAHNYWSHFGEIQTLTNGSPVIFIDVLGNVYSYEVVQTETLSPTYVEEMVSSKWDLTLFTCTYGGQSRVTIRCQRVDES